MKVPPVVYSTDRSKAVAPVLVLLLVALCFILRGDFFYVLPCVILFLCFSVLLAFREERASLGAFRAFVRFVFVWFCLFPLPLGAWEGLRFEIVVLPGIFSSLFLEQSVMNYLKGGQGGGEGRYLAGA